jgi:hypothetical protein
VPFTFCRLKCIDLYAGLYPARNDLVEKAPENPGQERGGNLVFVPRGLKPGIRYNSLLTFPEKIKNTSNKSIYREYEGKVIFSAYEK